jgi:hypothetical protein
LMPRWAAASNPVEDCSPRSNLYAVLADIRALPAARSTVSPSFRASKYRFHLSSSVLRNYFFFTAAARTAPR